jgi:putative transposase
MFAVRAMCRMLLVHPSGFYAWLREPLSQRALEDQRQTVLLKQAWDDSGEVYGYRKLHDDLCDLGEDISPNRAWRLARLAGIRAQIGYKKRPGSYGGSPAIVADNTLNREFDVDAPDQFWVTDITYIRTHEGFLYLAVVIDLFSRRVIGWSMQGRTYTDLPLQALLPLVDCRAINCRATDGCLAAQTKDKGPRAFRSGFSIHQLRVAGVPRTAQSDAKHEPPGELLG